VGPASRDVDEKDEDDKDQPMPMEEDSDRKTGAQPPKTKTQ